MDPIQARLISKGKGGKTAQAITYTGEGSERRSRTHHLIMKGSRWMGWNPDKDAIAFLDRAEKELQEIERSYQKKVVLAEIAPGEIQKVVDRIKRYKENSFRAGANPTVFDLGMEMFLSGVILDAEAIKKSLENEVVVSEKALAVVTANVEKLRVEIPREVEFAF